MQRANIPIVIELPTPPGLFNLDRRRVIGLSIEPGKLLVHRRQRQHRLNAPEQSSYTDPTAINKEIENARRIFEQGGFSVIDVTDKPIETSAYEVIDLITRRLKAESHKK